MIMPLIELIILLIPFKTIMKEILKKASNILLGLVQNQICVITQNLTKSSLFNGKQSFKVV